MKSTVLYDVTPCSLAEICLVHLYQTMRHSYSSLEVVNLCHTARRHAPENLQNSACIAICHPLWSDRTSGVQRRMHVRLSFPFKSICFLRRLSLVPTLDVFDRCVQGAKYVTLINLLFPRLVCFGEHW